MSDDTARRIEHLFDQVFGLAEHLDDTARNGELPHRDTRFNDEAVKLTSTLLLIRKIRTEECSHDWRHARQVSLGSGTFRHTYKCWHCGSTRHEDCPPICLACSRPLRRASTANQKVAVALDRAQRDINVDLVPYMCVSCSIVYPLSDEYDVT